MSRKNRNGIAPVKQESKMEENNVVQETTVTETVAPAEAVVDTVDTPAVETQPTEQETIDDSKATEGAEPTELPEHLDSSDGVTLTQPETTTEVPPVPQQDPVVVEVAAAEPTVAVSVVEAVAAVTGVVPPVVKDSLVVASIRHSFDEYIKKMAPGVPVSIKDGAANQARLYNTLMTIVNRTTDNDFIQSMALTLQLFNEHRDGVFHPRFVFRFMEHIELTSPRITAFQRLLNMFHLMAPAQSRQAVAGQCNWSETLSGEVTDAGRNRVLSFFKVG